MPTTHKKQLPSNPTLRRLVLGIWGTAFVLAMGLTTVLVIELKFHTSAAGTIIIPTRTNSPAPEFLTPTLEPAATKSPSPMPSLTPTPSILPATSTHQPSNITPARISPTPSPQAALPTVIGRSVANRPLEVYRFGSGSTERLIIAGIHGGYEWNTIALADELIEHLNQHPELIPPGMSLYILRALNPDGEASSHGYSGRANANGVDLNRNFPALWQANWSRSGCWNYAPITAGTNPASEPETIALMGFVQSHNIDALINYHSAALGIFPAGQPPDPISTNLAEAVAAVSDYAYPPIDTGCQFTGQLIDWASQAGIAALDIELTNHRDTDFDQNLLILSTFLDWKP